MPVVGLSQQEMDQKLLELKGSKVAVYLEKIRPGSKQLYGELMVEEIGSPPKTYYYVDLDDVPGIEGFNRKDLVAISMMEDDIRYDVKPETEESETD